MEAKTIIRTDKAPAPIGPYNQAVQFNNMLFISGQIPIDPANGNIITGDIQKETVRVMENLQAILSAAGLNFSNVVKSSIFLTSMSDFPVVNETYGKYFEEKTAPARETVEVSRLPKNVNVEISMIAVK